MKRENLIWLILLIVGGAFLFGRAMFTEHGMGKAYVEAQTRGQVNVDGNWVDANSVDAAVLDAAPAEMKKTWTIYEPSDYKTYTKATAKNPNQGKYSLSVARSIGVWVAALFTLFILTFLFKDNPLYKISESIFIGVSAAYWMVVGFHTTVLPNLIGKLSPDFVRSFALPGLGQDEPQELSYLIPLALGATLLWRLSPKGGWISRWPMAFIIGVFCGLRLITFLHADFLSQISNGIVSLWRIDPETDSFSFWLSLESFFLIVGVLSCLVYFFFSIEHKGMVGKTAKLGIWFLMITFGAAFGYTVMGRIALLAIRFEFLFDDWLWLIDPKKVRELEEVAAIVPGALNALGMA